MHERCPPIPPPPCAAGHLVLVPAPFHVRELLAATWATFHGLAKQRNITLSIEQPEGQWSRAQVVGDFRRLQQVSL